MSIRQFDIFKRSPLLLLGLGVLAQWPQSVMAQDQNQAEDPPLEELIVVGQKQSFSEVVTTADMLEQQSPITSVLATVDNIPGVNVTEGDTFGFDDWSTTINLRGYQTSLSDQQVGTMIDGFPNGESNYGGGAKANRYIDSMNLGRVEVNQGIADIASRSLEALGGTLNFITNDPLEEQRMRVQYSSGDFQSQRYYGRYDTGRILDDSTVAYFSFNHNEATDWMEESAQNQRDHAAFKVISDITDNHTLTGYLSYDDIQEDNYQRITDTEFTEDPDWDRLIGIWTDTPYVNQLYRQGWSTIRDNKFGYLKLNSNMNDSVATELGVYTHRMKGRGDWIPPYIGDVVDDNGGPETELNATSPTLSGSSLGNIYFVDADGMALTPTPGCQSSITFPYGGAGPEYDSACYPSNAIPVQSYRHTHYGRDRQGLTADMDWTLDLNGVSNRLRAGFWYEDSQRKESRDWHKLIDASVGINFNETAYWKQYDLQVDREVVLLYLEDQISIGDLTFSLGTRQFQTVDMTRTDKFGIDPDRALAADTDPLFSAGVNYLTPVDGMEVFVGYAENVKPIPDTVLDASATAITDIEAEQAENLEVGLRYSAPNLTASAVYFDNSFENRLQFFGPQSAGNIPDYDIGTDGSYKNVGGIEADGFELAANYQINEFFSIYGAYTSLDAVYLGLGSPDANAEAGVTPGNTVINTPDDMIVISLDWKRDNYGAGLSTKAVSDRYMDLSNSRIASDYTVMDFYLSVADQLNGEFLQGYEMRLTVNNLLDESYLGGISGFGAWIGAPRTAVFSLTLDL